MPSNKKERAIFAFITVLITVHAYVFYSLYVINGSTLMNATGESSVLIAINHLGGVYMFGRYLPIWAVVLTEFCFAYCMEMLVGSPFSFKMACKNFAAFLFYPYYAGFHIVTLLANWLKLICFNFPFAYFSQLFFIQPLVRTIFKFLFKKHK